MGEARQILRELRTRREPTVACGSDAGSVRESTTAEIDPPALQFYKVTTIRDRNQSPAQRSRLLPNRPETRRTRPVPGFRWELSPQSAQHRADVQPLPRMPPERTG